MFQEAWLIVLGGPGTDLDSPLGRMRKIVNLIGLATDGKLHSGRIDYPPRIP